MKRVLVAFFTHIFKKVPPLFIIFILVWLTCFAGARLESFANNGKNSCQETAIKNAKVSICSDPSKGQSSYSSLAMFGDEKIVCFWPYGTPENSVGKLGEVCILSGEMEPLSTSSYDKSLSRQGVTGKVRIENVRTKMWPSTISGHLMKYRNTLLNRVFSSSTSMEGALVAALVFGYKTRLSTLQELFKNIGLSHMLSVSGSHFALALGFLLYVLYSFDLRRSSLVWISLIFSLCFYYLTGMSIATLRACLMASGTQLAYFSHRRIDLLSLVSLTGILVLVFDPLSATSLSLQLSFSAVIGIALYYANLSSYFKKRFPLMPSWIVESIALGIAAQVLTIPLILITFRAISPLSVLSTLVTTALFEVIIVAGVLLMFVAPYSTLLSHLALRIAQITSHLIVECALALSNIPGMYVQLSSLWANIWALLFVFVACVLFCVDFKKSHTTSVEHKLNRYELKKRQLRISVFLIVLFLLWIALQSGALKSVTSASKDVDGVYFLNVGQGDATLIKDKGRNILIDAGPDELTLKRELNKTGSSHIDTLIFTHGHEDHIRGAELFGKANGVKRIIVARGTQNDAEIMQIANHTKAAVTQVLAGSSIQLPSGVLKVLSPTTSVLDSDDNASCLVMSFDETPDKRSDTDFLITGDAEASTLSDVILKYRLKRIGTLKLGHHGSKKSIDARVLDETSIQNVVISVGENSYGHPNSDILRLLKSRHVPYKRTDVSGTIFYRSMAQ